MSKPLHVLVAEALGWTRLECCTVPNSDSAYWIGVPPMEGEELLAAHPEWQVQVPSYDESWSVTGPLIERFGITLEYLPCEKHEGCQDLKWDAYADQRGPTESGATALRAVCDLILALSEAGKLEAK